MRCIALILSVMLMSSPTWAGNLKYMPISPDFGGSPSNGGNLLNEANAQNKYQAASAAKASASSLLNQTPAQRFASTFQQRLLASVADNITNAILGPKARDSGQFQIDGTTINFQRVGNNVNLTINDGVNQTSVVVPVGY